MQRLDIHVGLHKTGTTYLQNVLRANAASCADQGVHVPDGAGGRLVTRAVWDFHGRRPRGGGDSRIPGQWDALVADVANSELPRTLLSEERLSLCTRREAAAFVDAFGVAETHVVVTVRDLARVAPSAWQEEVKNGATWTWAEYLAALTNPDARATNPARGFWLRQDVVRICRTWARQVGSARTHVVTVPPTGSPPSVLLGRFCSVVGLDGDRLSEPPVWTNENLGAAATEVLRRVNVQVGAGMRQRQYDEVVKRRLVPELARTLGAGSTMVPIDDAGWLVAQALQTAAALAAAGYDVVGDLDDLQPAADPHGRAPDAYTEQELADAAVRTAGILTARFARFWWAARRIEESTPGAHSGSRLRAARFRGKRWAADLADRNAVAAKALGVVFRRGT